MVTEKTEAGPKLKPYPFKGSGVNENAALCMAKMVVPMCPCESDADAERIDAVFERQGRERRTRPPSEFRGVDNCQSGRYRDQWWVDCEKLGHNPYFLKTVTTREETVVDENGYVTGKRQKEVVKERLNVVQVPISLRHDSGRGVPQAVGRGAKTLMQLGYQNVCMMRNCELPAKLRYSHGEFCNDRHARLTKADQEEVFLVVWGSERTKWQKLRADQLDELNLGEAVKI
jgi:hypothetical protein